MPSSFFIHIFLWTPKNVNISKKKLGQCSETYAKTVFRFFLYFRFIKIHLNFRRFLTKSVDEKKIVAQISMNIFYDTFQKTVRKKKALSKLTICRPPTPPPTKVTIFLIFIPKILRIEKNEFLEKN